MVTAEEIRLIEDSARKQAWHRATTVNLGDAERLASQVGGGVLVAVGMLRGGFRGLVLAGLGGALLYRGATGHCELYHAIGANTADYDQGDATSVPARAGVHLVEAMTIDRPADELYAYWRDYSNIPKFMEHVKSVGDRGDNVSHWVVRGPRGMELSWDARIHNEEPGEMIAWRSLPGGSVDTAGSVHFRRAPGGRGTEVIVNEKINPPAGRLGVSVGKLLGYDPEQLTRESLRKLKMLMEAGEVATTKGQPSGRGSD